MADRRSDDYSDTKKFWESLDSQPSREETQLQSGVPPVPKPRSQVSSLSGSLLKTEESLENTSLREISQGSSRISSEQQVEYSETSSITNDSKHDLIRDDDSIIAEDRLEDESFPITDKLDSDGENKSKHKVFRIESLEYDADKSESSIYKVKEREDILDLDDLDDAGIESTEQEKQEESATSFYIGESATNIISKSTFEKKSDLSDDDDDRSPQLVQDDLSIQPSINVNLLPIETAALHKVPSGVNLQDEESVHTDSDKYNSRSEPKESLELSKSEEEPRSERSEYSISEKLDTSGSVEGSVPKPPKVIHSPIDSRPDVFGSKFGDDDEVSYEKSLEVDDRDVDKSISSEGAKSIVINEHDLWSASPARVQRSPIDLQTVDFGSMQKKIVTVEETKLNDLVDDFGVLKIQTAKVVHSPVDSNKAISEVKSIEAEPKETYNVEIPTSTVESYSNISTKTETVIIDDMWPTSTKAAIVHSPIQPYQSAVEFEHPTLSITDQAEQPQKANLVHSPVEDAKCTSQVEQGYTIQSDHKIHFQQVEPSYVSYESEERPHSITTKDTSLEYGYESQSKRAPVVHSPIESQTTFSPKESDYRDTSEASQLLSTTTDRSACESLDDISSLPKREASGSSNEDSINQLDVVHRTEKSKVTPVSRWSVTDPENVSSSGSHYDSFEKTDSRPLSSDVENLYTYGGSSEYQTAHDASLIPGSTEYVTAASTLEHSGKTISSHESMKSFDSESSGHLASREVSEASETLVPSTMDCDLPTDTQMEFELDENEERLASLEACSGVLLEDLSLDHISSSMKRSQEMIFLPDAKPLQTEESVDITEKAAPIEIIPRKPTEMEQSVSGLSFEESKLAGSLEDGSAFSVSLSSTSNVETIVENQADLASSIGSSLVGSFEMPSHLKDEFQSGQIDSLVMTSSFIRDDDLNSVNTQITTSEVSSESSNGVDSNRRSKGHRRNDSTAFVKTLDIGKLSGDEDDVSLEEEMIIHDVEEEEKKESGSDSDYDRYETEYSRAFKQPTKRSKKKAKLEKAEPKEIERKKSIPSIETIVEDVNAEIEVDYHEERPPSQNMQDYSNIPDITITDDPTKYVSDDEDYDTKAATSEPQQPVQPAHSNAAQKQVEEDEPAPIVPIKPTIPKKNDTSNVSDVHYAKQSEIKISDEQYEELIDRQYQTKITEKTRKTEYHDERLGGDSPTSDSFEMVDVEQPDISDEFVIIEEVAKEADELMTEGKGLGIEKIKYEKKHDDEVEKIIVKSAPAATNEGSRILEGRHDMAFQFEESPPNNSDSDSNGIDSSRKWVEMQLAEQAQNLRYPYDLERGVLEDIKEEDTDFEVGSSRISSFKESFSSTPDYEALLGRRYHHGKEPDAVSVNSLQEFESLEQAISLENRKYHQGSHDSSSNGSFPRRYNTGRSVQADDISLASLNEFEGLENACLEAHLIEIKAKEEHALLLSRSDESNKSNSSGKKVTTVTEVTDKDGVKKVTETTTTIVTKVEPVKISEERISGFTSQPIVTRTVEYRTKTKTDDIDDDLSSTNIMEVSTDSLELGPKHLKHLIQGKDSSHHGSSDSLEISKSADIMTSSIDSIEISKDKSSKSDADSIELYAGRDAERRDSIDSIDMQLALLAQATTSDRGSTDSNTQYNVQTTLTTSGNQIIETKLITSTTSVASSSGYGGGISKDISSDSLNLNPSEKDVMLTSSESFENTSSTNATYQNETDSQMSSSVTSCESNTLIDTLSTRGDRYLDFDDGLDTTRTTMVTTTTTVHRTVSKPNDQSQ